jgi:hypothetical protein
LLVTAIGLAAYSRADMPDSQRRDFFVYIDEFQKVASAAIPAALTDPESSVLEPAKARAVSTTFWLGGRHHR